MVHDIFFNFFNRKGSNVGGILLFVALLSDCTGNGFGQAGSKSMDWEFIQSVGGIKLGYPYLRIGRYWVPVFVDVSGAQTITVAPTRRNTGLDCTGAVYCTYM